DQVGHVLQLPFADGPHLLDEREVLTSQANDLQGVANRGQRIAQLVGQDGQEVVLLAGLAGHFLCPLLEGFFETLLRAAVAHDFGEAPQLPALVAQRGRDAVAPKALAILPHQPTVVVGPPRARRRCEFPRRLAVLDVLGRGEAGKMLAEDFRLPVAEDALRARVPGGHAPVEVEEENGVVGQALHQQAVLFFDPPQGTFRWLARGVARRAVPTMFVHRDHLARLPGALTAFSSRRSPWAVLSSSATTCATISRSALIEKMGAGQPLQPARSVSFLRGATVVPRMNHN